MVTMGKDPPYATNMVEFTILDMSEGAYNGITSQPTLSQFEVVISKIHLKMKFPTRYGTGEIQGSQNKVRACYLASTNWIKAQMETSSTSKRPDEPRDRNACTMHVPEESPNKGRPHKEVRSVPFDEGDPTKVFKIGTTLEVEHEAMLIRVLREYHHSIDQLVDSSAWYKVVGFLDAFRGYHHILMVDQDVEKTTFITEYGIYCWKVMAFGLKNAGATYQRMVNTTQIGRNIEISVDDMLIKSREAEDHEANLRKNFENLRKNKLRLNPDKCVFRVTSGKFLGYMIYQRGIEPNPEKISAVQAMQCPKTQTILGIAALTRFISRAGDRSLPFYKAIKKLKEFE
ncbi:hypothetical protein LIER_39048 [Lithospermum erythrorhizon]|uniref:Reverse transcriptase domain-containing protein n=1 Tax=Lithospermum erythrorhizon TaxID=34254 RepID=A0AAV3Q9H6_LITER